MQYQYGFSHANPTMYAISMAKVDSLTKDALNSDSCYSGCEKNSLVRSGEGRKEYIFTTEISQGSVLDFLLWNVMYDGVFMLPVAKEATIVGFADNLDVVVASTPRG